MLGEFANTGTIKWGYMTRYNATLLSSKQFETVFIQYHQMLNEGNRYASGTISGYKNSVKRFLCYLEEHGYRTLGRLNLQIVSDYISDTAQRIPCSISGILQRHDIVFALFEFLSRTRKIFIYRILYPSCSTILFANIRHVPRKILTLDS